jgi:NAD(P)-dependent dehydrogenase (short-subunit alcohol dehydrogenase family)
MCKPIEELTVEDFEFTMGVNACRTFVCCKRAIEQMRVQDGRRVTVNVASNRAFAAAESGRVLRVERCRRDANERARARGRAARPRVSTICPGRRQPSSTICIARAPEVREDLRRKTPLEFGCEPFLALPRDVRVEDVEPPPAPGRDGRCRARPCKTR